jgi:hypothetical protein
LNLAVLLAGDAMSQDIKDLIWWTIRWTLVAAVAAVALPHLIEYATRYGFLPLHYGWLIQP